MSDTRRVVQGVLAVRPDRVGVVLDRLTEVGRAALREPGCLAYDVHRSVEDETVLAFREEWADAAALEEHLAQPAVAAMLTALPSDLRDAPAVHVLRPIDPSPPAADPGGARSAPPRQENRS